MICIDRIVHLNRGYFKIGREALTKARAEIEESLKVFHMWIIPQYYIQDANVFM